MINEDEIVFLFKILLLGFDDINKTTWNSLGVQAIPESENVVPGVIFGVNTYLVEVNNKRLGTKIFYCAFNPQIVPNDVRKSYVRGANGIIIAISENDEPTEYIPMIMNVLEVNKDVIPEINLVYSGSDNKFSQVSSFIQDQIVSLAEKLNINDILEKTSFHSVHLEKLNENGIKDYIVKNITNLINKIS